MINIVSKLPQSFQVFPYSSYKFLRPVLDLSMAVGILLIVLDVSDPFPAVSSLEEVVPSDV
jgi:hypothetical protein